MSPAEEVIKYANMLNTENLSALRSGNISIRHDDGFLITPSGVKYSSLKYEDIVFVSLDGKFEEKKMKPSSEWRFHKDIYKKNRSQCNCSCTFNLCYSSFNPQEINTCISLHGSSCRW